MAGLTGVASQRDRPQPAGSDRGCPGDIWPIAVFLIFIAVMVAIVLMFARPEREPGHEPPCDSGPDGAGRTSSRR